MRRRLKLLRRASIEISEAFAWWTANRPAAPKAFTPDLRRALRAIAEQPKGAAWTPAKIGCVLALQPPVSSAVSMSGRSCSSSPFTWPVSQYCQRWNGSDVVFDAIFEDGVFKPKHPVDLDDKTEVRLIVHHA